MSHSVQPVCLSERVLLHSGMQLPLSIRAPPPGMPLKTYVLGSAGRRDFAVDEALSGVQRDVDHGLKGACGVMVLHGQKDGNVITYHADLAVFASMLDRDAVMTSYSYDNGHSRNRDFRTLTTTGLLIVAREEELRRQCLRDLGKYLSVWAVEPTDSIFV